MAKLSLNLCLLSVFILQVRSEIIVSNITRNSPVLKTSVTIKPTDISKPIIPPDVTSRSITSTVHAKNDFQVPRVISVDAREDERTGSYDIFPLPPTFHYPGNNGLEETFTYQVKKPGRMNTLTSPQGIREELLHLQQRAQHESLEAMHHAIEKSNKDIDSKIQQLTVNVENLSNGMIRNISAVTFAWDQLNNDVMNLSKVSKDTSRTVRSIQTAFEQEGEEKRAMAQQISNLTAEVNALKRQGSEDADKLVKIMAGLEDKLNNMTDDIRMHEAHLRYGQHAMTSLSEIVDKNVNRIHGLERDGGQQWAEQTLGCGGVVVANSGIISYKFRQPYLNNERCVWTLRVNRKTKVTIQLIEDGFQNKSNSDFLTVTEFAEDQHPVTLLTNTRLEHGNTAVNTFRGPVVFLTFYSDNDVSGTGFTLKFYGVGESANAESVNAIRHVNKHLSSPVGSFTYPNELGVTYQPNELLTVTLNPKNANSLKVSMKRSDLENDEFCEFDSISFYGSVTGSYALTKRYCQQGESLAGELIQSSDGIFIVIFRSDPSTQFSGFNFTWEIE